MTLLRTNDELERLISKCNDLISNCLSNISFYIHVLCEFFPSSSSSMCAFSVQYPAGGMSVLPCVWRHFVRGQHASQTLLHTSYPVNNHRGKPFCYKFIIDPIKIDFYKTLPSRYANIFINVKRKSKYIENISKTPKQANGKLPCQISKLHFIFVVTCHMDDLKSK